MRSRGAVHDLHTTGRHFHQHPGLGVRLGRLEAGQEALKASLGDVRQDLKDVRQDLKFLLRFAWGATAVIPGARPSRGQAIQGAGRPGSQCNQGSQPGPSCRGKPGSGRLAGATPPARYLPGQPVRETARRAAKDLLIWYCHIFSLPAGSPHDFFIFRHGSVYKR